MKNKFLYKLILIFIVFVAIQSCTCNINSKLPEVQNPTYQAYDMSGERGYWVEFQLPNDKVRPKFVVLNRIKKEILPVDYKALQYKVNVIAETRRLSGYEIKSTSQANGLIFEVDGKEYHKPVNFQLKK